MDVSVYIEVILNGICIGGLYGLLSSAWSFQVGALKFANFAYGASIMLSMYLTYFMIIEWNIPIVLAIILILAVNFMLGWVMRKTMLKGKDRNRMILCTMGLQLLMINLVTFIFTGYPRDMAIFETRIYLTERISIGVIQLICFVMSLVILFSFQYFLKKTWTGRAIRSVVQNKEVATLMGINSEKMLDVAYSLSYMLIGISAMMLMTMYQVEPAFGTSIQSTAFMVCVIAGLGNLSGAFFSGIFVGVISGLLSMIVGAQYLNPIIYTLFVIVLLVKPYGLFTKSTNIARKL